MVLRTGGGSVGRPVQRPDSSSTRKATRSAVRDIGPRTRNDRGATRHEPAHGANAVQPVRPEKVRHQHHQGCPRQVQAKLPELQKRCRKTIKIEIIQDSRRFIREAMKGGGGGGR